MKSVHSIAFLLLIAFCGCSRSPSIDGSVAPKAIASKEWTLADRATFDATIMETPIDEYSVIATLVVHHRFAVETQSPIDKLEKRNAAPDALGEWYEMKEKSDRRVAGTQIYEMPFSAPSPLMFEFRVTKNDKSETLIGWKVE